MPAPLLIATGNRHKLEEIAAILRVLLPHTLFDFLCAGDFQQIPEPVEDGTTFEENALIKASTYAEATGLLTLADDSGLVIDALDGRPGIHSARYDKTPQARIDRVLRELDGVATAQRGARFVCAVALCDGAGRHVVRRGTVEGRITTAMRGADGFGYDPIFEVHEPQHGGLTLAELPAAEKNGLSHRARALVAVRSDLEAALRQTGRWAQAVPAGEVPR